MPLDHEELLGRRFDHHRFSYTDTQSLLYNLSIGMGADPLDAQELSFVFEEPQLRVVPTFAAVLGGGRADILDGAPIDWPKVLHGEQRLRIHRPLPAAADLIGSGWISEITDKGADKGATITITLEARLASGEVLYTTDNVIFARGNGGGGGPSKSRFAPPIVPERAPDHVLDTPTRRDQALLYRLNGDRNPLHADPGFANKVGFPAPILHGLCTYGIACRVLLAQVCHYDAGRIREFDVRFTQPLFPGETIQTELWTDGANIAFRCRVAARGATLLVGRCVVGAAGAPAG